jgi:hypothetical protein
MQPLHLLVGRCNALLPGLSTIYNRQGLGFRVVLNIMNDVCFVLNYFHNLFLLMLDLIYKMGNPVCIYIYIQGLSTKSTRHAEANTNTLKENQDNDTKPFV